MRTIELHDAKIHQIFEQEGAWYEPQKLFPGLKQEILDENRQWLEDCGGLCRSTGKIILRLQSYVIRTAGKVILVDTCIGNHKQRPTHPYWHMHQSDNYMKGLAEVGLTVDDIDVVMCTHLHIDHVGWNTRLENGHWVPTFPNARYLFSEKEFSYWSDLHKLKPNAILEDSVLPVVEAGQVDWVTSSFRFDDAVSLISTPGHSPDHFSVAIQSGGHRAVVTGDMVHSPLQLPYPDLTLPIDFDPDLGTLTRRRMFEEWHHGQWLVCTSHFPSPSVGMVSSRDGRYCFDFVPYRSNDWIHRPTSLARMP